MAIAPRQTKAAGNSDAATAASVTPAAATDTTMKLDPVNGPTPRKIPSVLAPGPLNTPLGKGKQPRRSPRFARERQVPAARQAVKRQLK